MIDQLIEEFTRYGIKIVIAIVAVIIGRKLIRVFQKLLVRVFERANVDRSIRKFLESSFKVCLYAVLISIVAALLGLDTTSFLAVLGSAGLAVGLALQGSLSNFAGGVLILVLKPFRVNDFIIACGVDGKVEAIDLFYTSMLTVDNRKITIPNGTLANSVIMNVTAEEVRRLDLAVGIGYSSDLRKAKELIAQILHQRESVLKDREILVYVDSLGESAVTLGFRCWVDAGKYWTERCTILEQVKLGFDAEGIEIPFNQLDVHLRQAEAPQMK